MLIHELTRQASLDVLASAHLGRLACAQGMQPYVVPFHFAYRNCCVYSFSMLGQKIDWMRANPSVCVEASHIVSPEQWTSVVAFGRYEELLNTAEMQSERALALKLLQQRAAWWEPGYVKITHDATPSQDPVFYRVHVVHITGRRATSEPEAPGTRRSTADSAKRGWLNRILRRVRRT